MEATPEVDETSETDSSPEEESTSEEAAPEAEETPAAESAPEAEVTPETDGTPEDSAPVEEVKPEETEEYSVEEAVETEPIEESSENDVNGGNSRGMPVLESEDIDDAIHEEGAKKEQITELKHRLEVLESEQFRLENEVEEIVDTVRSQDPVSQSQYLELVEELKFLEE